MDPYLETFISAFRDVFLGTSPEKMFAEQAGDKAKPKAKKLIPGKKPAKTKH